MEAGSNYDSQTPTSSRSRGTASFLFSLTGGTEHVDNVIGVLVLNITLYSHSMVTVKSYNRPHFTNLWVCEGLASSKLSLSYHVYLGGRYGQFCPDLCRYLGDRNVLLDEQDT